MKSSNLLSSGLDLYRLVVFSLSQDNAGLKPRFFYFSGMYRLASDGRLFNAKSLSTHL